MTPNTRLAWCGILIFGSAIYAVLIAYNPRLAADVMLGYIGIVLTILTVINVWKRS